MRHNTVIHLITKTYESDAFKVQKEIEHKTRVFANELSVSAREFYEAGVSKLRPEKQFEIYSFEYNDEELLEHSDKKYIIIRTNIRGDKVRLVCGEVTTDD